MGVMQPATRESLASIRVVYCAPDTCLLYGIPYEMRTEIGQAPRHLWEASRTRFDRPVADGPSGRVYLPDPTEEWVYLDERDPMVKVWLGRVRERDGLPGWPHEWQTIEPMTMADYLPPHRSESLHVDGEMTDACDLTSDL